MVASPPGSSGTLQRSLLAGLAAGAVAALIASLVSLPLESPDDVFFNTASVTLGALLTGLLAGALWWALRGRGTQTRTFVGAMLAAFVVVAVATLVIDLLPNSPLERLPGFVIPLAGIVLGMLAVLTPVFARPALRPQLVGPVAAVAALALGIGLAGQGDAESGRLSLPDAPPGSTTGSSPAAPSGQGAGPAGQAATSNDGVLRPRDVAGAEFVVTPGESVATYTVREKLAQLPRPNEAVGRTTEVRGTIYLDGRPSKVVVDLSKLQSDQPMRDNYIRTRGPELNKYPLDEFIVSDLRDLPVEYRPGETVTRNITGTMKIREVERPLTFAVEARLQDNVLYVLGRTDFTWADFQIPPPNIAGRVQVEDNVHVEVLLVGRRGAGQ